MVDTMKMTKEKVTLQAKKPAREPLDVLLNRLIQSSSNIQEITELKAELEEFNESNLRFDLKFQIFKMRDSLEKLKFKGNSNLIEENEVAFKEYNSFKLRLEESLQNDSFLTTEMQQLLAYGNDNYGEQLKQLELTGDANQQHTNNEC